MLKFVFLIVLAVTSLPMHAEDAWSWLRVEAGISGAVVMRGHATTLSKSQGKLVLRLADDDKLLDDFVVNLSLSGSNAEAEFEPPNTERIVLRVAGNYRQTPSGDGTVHERFVLANTQNGNFLVVSRFRPTRAK